MSTLNKVKMGVAAASFGAAMMLAPIVTQAKEVNIRVQAVLGMMQFMVIQLIGLAMIFIFPQIALWLPTYIYGQ